MSARLLQQFEQRPGVSVTPKGQATELTLVRGAIEVRVLVPEGVLEWFVEAEDRNSGTRISDWCDYAGYDDTPPAQLQADMAADVAAFVDASIQRDLRYSQDSKGGGRFEWLVEGNWQQAVPLVSPRRGGR